MDEFRRYRVKQLYETPAPDRDNMIAVIKNQWDQVKYAYLTCWEELDFLWAEDVGLACRVNSRVRTKLWNLHYEGTRGNAAFYAQCFHYHNLSMITAYLHTDADLSAYSKALAHHIAQCHYARIFRDFTLGKFNREVMGFLTMGMAERELLWYMVPNPVTPNDIWMGSQYALWEPTESAAMIEEEKERLMRAQLTHSALACSLQTRHTLTRLMMIAGDCIRILP